ncbi:N,N-dimethylformamidase beta subunit family domain-containing protein [Streptomyces sp. NPDC048577]|uniref:N,N-dimethylformamidase beta subunit family domain-containing protein n=1 Tax=Streptomyces sp. NPDC048577 TaxID=3157209 RepID=UPI003440C5CA
MTTGSGGRPVGELSRRTVLRTLGAGTGVAASAWWTAGPAEALPTAPPVSTGDNPVVRENTAAGSDEWGLGCRETCGVDLDRPQIQGSASTASVAPGETLGLRLSSRTARSCTVEVYRLGHYGGLRARHLLTAEDVPVAAAGARPAWTLRVPPSWVSGIFLAVLTSADGHRAYAPFVVRDPARRSDVLAVVPLSAAAGAYPGLGMPPGFATDTSAARWLEESGYDVTYATEEDLHRARVDPARYGVVVLPGSPGEGRWARRTRAAVTRSPGGTAGLRRPFTLSEPGHATAEARRAATELLDGMLATVSRPRS